MSRQTIFKVFKHYVQWYNIAVVTYDYQAIVSLEVKQIQINIKSNLLSLNVKQIKSASLYRKKNYKSGGVKDTTHL